MNFSKLHDALLIAALCSTSPVWAGPGHDHAHGDAAPTTAGPALPRFSAVSEMFELVGVLSGKQLTLYLDRFNDNSPVPNAQIELDIGGTPLKADKHGDDMYEVVLAAAPKPGVMAITATVFAGDETDLLVGELEVPEPTHESAHESAHADEAVARRTWAKYAGGLAVGVAVLALLLLLLLVLWRRPRLPNARSVRAGGAA